MDLPNDYQFVMIPQQLAACLDANCNKMLSTLIGLHTLLANEDGWFYRSNADLQGDTRLGETLVRATLDTLFQAEIIDIDCIGKGKGHRSNRIHINFDSFKKYQQYSFNDIRNNPDLWIDTIKYKGSGFSTSYSQKSSQETSQRTSQKLRTNTNTTDTSNSLNTTKELNTKEEIETSQKVRTNTENEKELPNCMIDFIEEEKSLKEFVKEDMQEMKNSFNIDYSVLKLDDNMKVKGFECCRNFINKYQNLDYQLLMNDSKQFLSSNEIKMNMLSQTISSNTGVYFSTIITTGLLKDYLITINNEYQEGR